MTCGKCGGTGLVPVYIPRVGNPVPAETVGTCPECEGTRVVIESHGAMTTVRFERKEDT